MLVCACAAQANAQATMASAIPVFPMTLPLSVRGHSIMAQKGVDLGLAAAEGDEGFERRAAAPGGQHLAAEALAGGRVEHAVLLERAVGVGRKHLGPLVAVVARRIGAGEDVGELVREAVVLRD